MTPDIFADRMTDIVYDDYKSVARRNEEALALMIELLEDLGFSDGVEMFEDILLQETRR